MTQTRDEFIETLPQSTRRISWSAMSSYTQCGEKYRLQYQEHVPKRVLGAGLAGSAVHEVIADYLIAGGYFMDPAAVEHDGAIEFIEAFTRKVEEAGGPDNLYWGGQKRLLRDEHDKPVIDPKTGEKIKVGEDFQWFCKMGPTFVKRAGAILREDRERGFTIVEAATEIGVSTWLDEPGGTLLHGMIDVSVIADSEDVPRIRDWKSGSLMNPYQLANYGWLWERVFGDHIEYGEFAKLRAAKPEDRLLVYPLDPMYPIVEEMFRRTLGGIDAGYFGFNPSSFCVSCTVKDSCAHGRTLEP